MLYETFDLEDGDALSTADLTVLLLSSLRALVAVTGKGRVPGDAECEREALGAYARLGKAESSRLTKDDLRRFVDDHVHCASLEHIMHDFGALTAADLPPPPPPVVPPPAAPPPVAATRQRGEAPAPSAPAVRDEDCVTLGVAFEASGQYCVCSFTPDGLGGLQIRGFDPETDRTYRGVCDASALGGTGRDAVLRVARALKIVDDGRIVVDPQSRCSTPDEPGRRYLSSVGVAFQTGDYCVCSMWRRADGGLWVRGFDPASDRCYEGSFDKSALPRADPSNARDFARAIAAHLRISDDGSLRFDVDASVGSAGRRHVATLGVAFPRAGKHHVCSFWTPGDERDETLWVKAFDPDTGNSFEAAFFDVPPELDNARDRTAALAARLDVVDGQLVIREQSRRYLATTGVAFKSGQYCVCSFWRTADGGLAVRCFDQVDDDVVYEGEFADAELAAIGLDSMPAATQDAHDWCEYVLPHLEVDGDRVVLNANRRGATPTASTEPLGPRTHVAMIGVRLDACRYCVASFWATGTGGVRVRGFDPDTECSYRGAFQPSDWAPLGLGPFSSTMSHDDAHELCYAIAPHLRAVASADRELELELDLSSRPATPETAEAHSYHVATVGVALRETNRHLVCSFWTNGAGLRLRGFDVLTDEAFPGEISDSRAALLDLGDEPADAVDRLPRDRAEAACARIAAHLELTTTANGDSVLTFNPNRRSSQPDAPRQRYLSTVGVALGASRRYCVCSFWQARDGVLVHALDPDTDKAYEGFVRADQWAPLGLAALTAVPLAKAHDFCHLLAPHLTLLSDDRLVLDATVRPSTPGARLGRPSSAKVRAMTANLLVDARGREGPLSAARSISSRTFASASSETADPHQEAPVPDAPSYRKQVAGGVAEAQPPAPAK